MRALLPLLLLAAPAPATTPHSGTLEQRTAPELSDIALFVMAAAGVFLARRAMLRRFDKRRED